MIIDRNSLVVRLPGELNLLQLWCLMKKLGRLTGLEQVSCLVFRCEEGESDPMIFFGVHFLQILMVVSGMHKLA